MVQDTGRYWHFSEQEFLVAGLETVRNRMLGWHSWRGWRLKVKWNIVQLQRYSSRSPLSDSDHNGMKSLLLQILWCPLPITSCTLHVVITNIFYSILDYLRYFDRQLGSSSIKWWISVPLISVVDANTTPSWSLGKSHWSWQICVWVVFWPFWTVFNHCSSSKTTCSDLD